MEKVSNTLNADSNDLIEKIFRKYILEVDDAIEAHGFKATSYIDYAEDTISELENKMKEEINLQGIKKQFLSLEDNLKTTVNDIVENTKKTAYERKEIYNCEQIEKKADELYTSLNSLNTRFINRMEAL
jgi:poly-D-alanine transfer protein DltD